MSRRTLLWKQLAGFKSDADMTQSSGGSSLETEGPGPATRVWGCASSWVYRENEISKRAESGDLGNGSWTPRRWSKMLDWAYRTIFSFTVTVSDPFVVFNFEQSICRRKSGGGWGTKLGACDPFALEPPMTLPILLWPLVCTRWTILLYLCRVVQQSKPLPTYQWNRIKTCKSS